MTSARIMVVEDELIGSESVRMSVESLGYDICCTASSGEISIGRAKEYKPDLVLMEIAAKGEIDGIEAAAMIRSLLRIPVVLLSAEAEDERIERAKLTEPFGYLVKPFHDRELKATIEMALYKAQAERKLQDLHNQITSILGSITDGFFALDNQLVITYVNKAAEELVGRKKEDVLGRSLTEAFPEIRGSIFEERFSLAVRERMPLKFEAQLEEEPCCNWYEVRIFPHEQEGVSVFFQVTTERRQAQQAMRALVEGMVREFETDFFDSLASKLCEWLDCECALVGEIRDGGSVDALSMKLDGAFVRGYSYKLEGAPCKNVLSEGYCVYPDRICELFPEDVSLAEMGAVGYVGSPIRDERNNPIGILCAVSRHRLELPKGAEDVMSIFAARASAEIARKKSEDARAKMEAHLRQAQKMEAIGTLAGGIAHDFNNILSPIMGYTEMVLHGLPHSSPIRTDLEEVVKAAHRAKNLVKQILAFSRHGREQERMLLDAGLIIKEAMKLLRASLPTTIEIVENIERGMALVDATQIQQILINLCTNAAHAMEERGTLEVSLAPVYLSEQDLGSLSIRDHKPCDYLKLRVTDTGHGMDSSTVERIFDPYFTTKEVGKGSGLGLAVVHGIVKRHEGAIAVRSEVGKGSTFDIYLPMAKAEVEGRIEPNPVLPKGTERILLVDDEQVVVELGKRILERLGYQVVPQTSSLEALELFRAAPDELDLIITDYTMPHLTGIELVREAFRIRPDIPIILCTGLSEKIMEGVTEDLGIVEIAMKPLGVKQLAELVRKALDAKRV